MSESGTTYRILIVEDEDTMCAMLEHALSEHGFDVTCASGDTQACDILEREGLSFSALLLDINLGRGTTGFDVSRFARRINPSAPVLYMSGSDSALFEKFGVPGSRLIKKPFDIGLLLAKLGEMTGSNP